MNLERLNINVNGIPSPGFSGEHSLFERLAGLVGSDMPNDYIQFILEVDGGHPEVGCFRVMGDYNSNNIFDVDCFYSLNNSSVESVENEFSKWVSILGPRNLPIGRDGGGNQIYLNFVNELPSVWLYLHDEEGAKLKISNSFTEFLDGLFMNPDFI